MIFPGCHRDASTDATAPFTPKAQESPDRLAKANTIMRVFYDRKPPKFDDRSHLFGICWTVMRRILVEQARARGGKIHVDIKEAAPYALDFNRDQLITIDEALKRLEHDAPRASQVIKLRYLDGLTPNKVAEALGISLSTMKRDERLAKELLLKFLS